MRTVPSEWQALISFCVGRMIKIYSIGFRQVQCCLLAWMDICSGSCCTYNPYKTTRVNILSPVPTTKVHISLFIGTASPPTWGCVRTRLL